MNRSDFLKELVSKGEFLRGDLRVLMTKYEYEVYKNNILLKKYGHNYHTLLELYDFVFCPLTE